MSLDDKILTNRFNNGDKECFYEIFNQYYDKILAYANFLVKDKNTAREIVDDLFYKLLLMLHNKNKINTSLKSYLFKSTFNNCIKYLSKSKIFTSTDEIILNLREEAIIEKLDNEKIYKRLKIAIEKLPSQCKLIFEKHFIKGLKYIEIAEELNVSLGTVKQQLNRALNKIREELSDLL